MLPQFPTIEHHAPKEIESASMRAISAELSARNIIVPEEQKPVVYRAIHASADFDYAETMCYSEGAVEKAKALLAGGADIVTDTNMALAGINKKTLKKHGGTAYCFMAEESVAAEAKARGLTRATVSMERAAKLAEESGKKLIFAIGNAPTALIRLHEMMQLREAGEEGGFLPDFIIGVPVGFVNVEAAKELILESKVPYIVNRGRKGGSNVAAAICNALLYEMR